MRNIDREMLELAAKAAGIEGKWAKWDHAYGDYREYGLDYGGRTLWNPITDDGDALRLAVKLKLTPMMRDFGCDVTDFVGIGCAYEKWSSDPYADTRRAIVRAAAEIGREIKNGEVK